jgi:hypothetical protein
MHRFLMKEAFNLKSEGNKLYLPGQYLATDDEAQLAELAKFAKDGSCVELLPQQPKAPEKSAEVTVDQTDDISLLKLGKAVTDQLVGKGITTKTALKSALGDNEVKAILGDKFEKVSEKLK